MSSIHIYVYVTLQRDSFKSSSNREKVITKISAFWQENFEYLENGQCITIILNIDTAFK